MGSDPQEPTDRELVELIGFGAAAGTFGALWLNKDLIVTRRLGSICAFVGVGRPVSDSVMALFGQEERLTALRLAPGTSLHLPNVAVVAGAGQAPRLRITVRWSAEIAQFVVVMARVAAGDVRDGALEDEVRKRRIADEALGRANQRLEEFVHIISHDLKEPMRAIRYLAGELSTAITRDPPDLPDAAARCLTIEEQSRRMSAMLVDLLDYSRIGREYHEPELIDVGVLVEGIVQSNSARPGIRIVSRGDLPTIRAHRVPFEVVMRNLVGNGVKHHDLDGGHVAVWLHDGGDRWVIGVADDGPGIPVEWQDDVFLPFRKLELDSDIESTGIGLALVRRAVESVGGKISIHSDPARQRGTRFEVTWPKTRTGAAP